MIHLTDGRDELFQWETDRTVKVDSEVDQVHFSNKFFGRSWDMDVVDGIAHIPDELLQVAKDIKAWAYVGTAASGYTKVMRAFKVNPKNKPENYYFTPTDRKTLADKVDKMQGVANAGKVLGIGADGIVKPVEQEQGGGGFTEETDPTVPAWAKQPNKPSYTADEVGALPKECNALRYCGTYASSMELPPTDGREVGDVFIGEEYDRDHDLGECAVMWDGKQFVPFAPKRVLALDGAPYYATPCVGGVVSYVQAQIDSAIAAYDADASAYLDEALALLGEDGDGE